MKIFIDVDNTILEHYGFYSYETEGRLHYSIANFADENIDAIKAMYDSSFCRDPRRVKELFLLDNVYILTKYPAHEYEDAKQKKLCKIFNMTQEQLLNARDSKNNLKYIALKDSDSKVNVVKNIFHIDTLKDCFLVDDYSENIVEWEHDLGIGIKYYNEYNSMRHPSSGISISNFNIFNPMIDRKSFNLITLAKSSNYVVQKFIKTLMDKGFDYINFKEIIYEDLLSRLELNELSESYKHKHYDFMVSYYMFVDDLKPSYWIDKINKSSKMLISCPFDIKNIDTKFKEYSSLSIEILSDDAKKKTVSDVYIQVEEVKNIYDTDDVYQSLFNIISNIIDVEEDNEQI